jgi:hypothetical protein
MADGFQVAAFGLVITSPQSKPSDAEISVGRAVGGLLQISNNLGVERHAHGDASNAGLL